MKPLPPTLNFVLSSRRYASTMSRLVCTNESKLKTKSTDESGIIDNERPSLRQQRTCEVDAKRRRHASMHSLDLSTAHSSSQQSFRKRVHRPKPGPISKIVPTGRQSRMRGKIVPDHCAAELPQGADHSSPACFQSYFIWSQWIQTIS